MDGTELDEIMNEAPALEVVETVVATPPQAEAQPRDDAGKFAAKTETDTIVDPDNAAQAAVEGGEHEKGKVPVAAVQAEREKRQKTENDNAELRRQMQEMSGQIRLLNERGTQSALPVETAKPKNFWEGPDEFLRERLAPVQQAMQQQRFEMSRIMAEDRLGADVVQAADAALGALSEAKDPQLGAVLQRITSARHPYAEMVKWHESHKAMADIGDDPKAYQERERERIRAELMAELGIEQQPAGTPSTTTKPLTKLPQSLSRLPGSGNGAGASDMSDAGIFTEAMSGR